MSSNPKVNMSIQAAKKVNGLADPTKPFSSFMKYNKNDLDMTMQFIKAPAMNTFLKAKVFSMVKDNMMETYKKCPWGWNGKDKRAELFHKDSRYILVRHSSNNSIAAFVHFRFDIENLIEVLYLYEIQIDKDVRGKGLGRYLMSLLETIAFHYKMKRIVLTVLKSEEDVVKFYFSLQYEIESYSPEDAFYYILMSESRPDRYRAKYAVVMSFAAYCVALASALAFVSEATDPETSEPGRPVAPAPGYPDWSLQYLDDVHKATRSHDDDVMFLRKMMEMDYLWWPILNEPVRIKRPTVPYFDQYKEPGPSVFLEKNELPFDLISTMMTENTFTGSDVVYAMDAFKSAMACSVLKHVSLQALMLHNLLTKFHHEIPDDERVMFEGWLVNMIQVGTDKLTAMDHSQDPDQSITRARALLVEMMRALSHSTADHTIGNFQEIAMRMYAEIDSTCAVPKGEKGHYSALAYDLNRRKRVEELKAHRTQLTENMREAAGVSNVDIMHKYRGDIVINAALTANDISELSEDTMKRATAANHIQMNFLYLNLPIQILSESQWKTISKPQISSKPENPNSAPLSL